MDLQQDLFEDIPSPETSELPTPMLVPLAVPCAWRNRRDEPCQRLARRPLSLDGQPMHSEGRPLLRCEIACFNGPSAGGAHPYQDTRPDERETNDGR